MEPPVWKGEMDERRRKDVPKLYIPSTINTQINLVLLMVLGPLGLLNRTESFCNLLKFPIFDGVYFIFLRAKQIQN